MTTKSTLQNVLPMPTATLARILKLALPIFQTWIKLSYKNLCCYFRRQKRGIRTKTWTRFRSCPLSFLHLWIPLLQQTLPFLHLQPLFWRRSQQRMQPNHHHRFHHLLHPNKLTFRLSRPISTPPHPQATLMRSTRKWSLQLSGHCRHGHSATRTKALVSCFGKSP